VKPPPNPKHLPWRDVIPAVGIPISTSLLTEEAIELANFARGKRVLELGSGFGYSTVVMALAGATHIDTIDKFIGFNTSRGELEKNLAAYGVSDTVTIHEIYTHTILTEFEPDSFDLVFIDAGHQYNETRHDAELSWKLLKPGGYLAGHDYDEDCNPGVREALDDVFPDGPLRVTGTLFIIQK
jgi:predicted O-methyltransferase YrrM